MKIDYNPHIAFRAETQPTQAKASESATKPAEPDTFKKSGSVKEDIGRIAKFSTTLGEMTKAAAKAIGYGAATAAAGLTCGWLFGALPRGFKKGGSIIKTFKNPLQSISKKAKIITGLSTAAVAGYQLIKGKLATNQKTSNVDHQLKIGHRKG